MLDRDTFGNQKSAELLEDFVLAKVDVDEDEESPVKYQVEYLPTLVFLDSKGHEIHRVDGFVDYDTLEKIVKDVKKKAGH